MTNLPLELLQAFAKIHCRVHQMIAFTMCISPTQIESAPEPTQHEFS